MTNTRGTIYCEFINSCVLKNLKQTMGIEQRNQSSGKLLKVRLTTVIPCSPADVQWVLTYNFQWTAWKRLQKLIEENSIQIYYATSQSLAQKVLTAREFFLYFHSDSAEFIMLQKVKYVKPKYLFQPLPEVQYYFLSLDYLMHLPSTKKEKHTYQKSIFLCLLLNKLIE